MYAIGKAIFRQFPWAPSDDLNVFYAAKTIERVA